MGYTNKEVFPHTLMILPTLSVRHILVFEINITIVDDTGDMLMISSI